MNGTGHVNGASSPEPESPKSHWSSLTGATSESETAVDEDGLPPAVPTQSDYGTPSVGHTHDSARIPIEGDGPAEPWITRPRISDTQSGAQIGDNPRFRGNSETNRTRVEDVRLDPAILGLPPIPRLFDEEISPMIQTPRAETPTTKNLGEKAPESEAPNTESIPATQTMATTTSTKETSNEQKGEMSNAETMPTMTTGLSARETSTEDETETADTETSSGQPMFWTAINRPTQIPRTEQQAREVPVSVKPTNPGVADVPQQLDGDMPSSILASDSPTEQRPAEEPSGTPQTKPTDVGPPEPMTPPSKRIRSEQSSTVQTSTLQSPPSSQKRRRASSPLDGGDPASGGSRKRAQTTHVAWDAQSSPSLRRSQRLARPSTEK